MWISRFCWHIFAVLFLVVVSITYTASDCYAAIRLAGIASVTTISANCYPLLTHPKKSVKWAKAELKRLRRKKT